MDRRVLPLIVRARLIAAAAVVLSSAARISAAEPAVDYIRHVKPLLRQHCYACHGALTQKSGLRLDTAALVRKGGETGTVVEPGQPDESVLIERVGSTGPDRMPPKDQGTPLNAEEIAVLRRWIAKGASGPDDERPEVNPREHWSYKPAARPALPALTN